MANEGTPHRCSPLDSLHPFLPAGVVGDLNDSGRENVGRTFAAILERRNPGLRVSIDVDAANLAPLPADRQRRGSAGGKKPDAVADRLSRVSRAA